MLNIQNNILLAPYTTFKIGGPARYFVSVSSEEELKSAAEWAKKNNLPILILGGGSNVLISDKGFNGLVIKIQDSRFKIQDSEVICGAGVPLMMIVSEAVKDGLSGLEWAIGIPGTIGGAIRGNAGAFGKAIGEFIESAEVFDVSKMKIVSYSNENCRFGYRDSIFKKNSNLIILRAIVELRRGEKENIRNLIKEYLSGRPTGLGKSAGCFFKNIPWSRKDLDKELLIKSFSELKIYSEKPKIATGFLIDHLGLKGKKIGGAEIPAQHANYIINTGNASAEDVVMLASLVKERVQHHYGFLLEEEVELVGFN